MSEDRPTDYTKTALAALAAGFAAAIFGIVQGFSGLQQDIEGLKESDRVQTQINIKSVENRGVIKINREDIKELRKRILYLEREAQKK